MKYLLWDEGRGNMLAYRVVATRFLQPRRAYSKRSQHREQDDVNKTTMNRTMNKTAENT
jgi:hypothetical protein